MDGNGTQGKNGRLAIPRVGLNFHIVAAGDFRYYQETDAGRGNPRRQAGKNFAYSPYARKGSPVDYRLLLSTFVLIFLAELGDKTQLAALARSATGDKWTVFFAAASALVLSTLIAVLCGSMLTKVIPEVHIKIASGILFLAFGMFILYHALRPAPAVVAAAEVKPGLLVRFVLNVAAQFEEAARQDYVRLAASCEEPRLRRLLQALAAEEAGHLARVRATVAAHGESSLPAARSEDLPPLAQLAADVAEQDRPLLAHAIEHELATAGFYEELAKVIHIPALKGIFASLAAEEREHARRLAAVKDEPAS